MTAVGFAFFLSVPDRRRRRAGCSRSACSSRASTWPSSSTCCSRIRTGGSSRRGCARCWPPATRCRSSARCRRCCSPTSPTLGCDDCPPSAILDRPTTTRVFAILDVLTSALAVVLVGYVLYVLVKRWQAATQPQRRAMAPVLWSGICLLVVLAGSLTLDGGRRARRRLETRPACSASSSSRSCRTASCSACCARACCRPARSPSCCTGWATRPTAAACASCSRRRSATARCRSSTGSRTSAAGSTPPGRPAALPAEDDPARAVHRASSARAARVGAIVHDRSLCEDPELVRSVAAAAGLSIENERLQAQLRARVEELRALARPDRRGRHGRAPPARAQPARRRPAAARRAVADDAARAGPAAQGPGRRRDSCSAAPRRSWPARSRSCASWRAASIPPCCPTAGCGRRSRRSPAARPCRSSSRARRPSGCPPPVEAAAYFVVAEALTNVVKYANASQARVTRLAQQRPRGRRGRRRRRRRRRSGPRIRPARARRSRLGARRNARAALTGGRGHPASC